MQNSGTPGIVITVPSSPVDSTYLREGLWPSSTPTESPNFSDLTDEAAESCTHRDAERISSATTPDFKAISNVSSFESRLAMASLPPPGPAYFHARRALWWASGPNPPQRNQASTSRQKLEDMLRQEGAVESDQVWDAGLARVWNGLINGVRLKKRLPLSMVVRTGPMSSLALDQSSYCPSFS
ncbi:hypothetical protein AcW1_004411 [Taiwanofungus camphoratus]|nr:hypothetical protein AcW2_006581 [Antrodia cinnamomea]KAI0939337.1 hypothetical protein AcV5_000788 [Antrodia cinnamomea]KAI0952256.1 hypothetical protein AcV7_008127 [Antrodia cinnamomea]KAI0959635.1 hypothetical protein AcW1_004411 [Antrodia cinnamomea]